MSEIMSCAPLVLLLLPNRCTPQSPRATLRDVDSKSSRVLDWPRPHCRASMHAVDWCSRAKLAAYLHPNVQLHANLVHLGAF